uniref:NECAP endocytosis associated 2 n=1 Tax=Nothoprocta perdicaria TaxID=30464 RepID=A0A8C6ZGJ5_NOTPE
MEEGEYEAVLCVKPAVLVYRLPPRASNRGYRAAEWQLDQPAWSGRMRITAKGKVAFIKLEDKTSGELFAQAPVEQFPGVAVESVTDSSRYFVIRIEDGNGTAPGEAAVWGKSLEVPHSRNSVFTSELPRAPPRAE